FLYIASLLPHCSLILFPPSLPHRLLHSFPTRRSSDLVTHRSSVSQGPSAASRGRCPHSALSRPSAHRQEEPLQAQPRTSEQPAQDRKSTRLNSSHVKISYAVFCLKKKNATTDWNK